MDFNFRTTSMKTQEEKIQEQNDYMVDTIKDIIRKMKGDNTGIISIICFLFANGELGDHNNYESKTSNEFYEKLIKHLGRFPFTPEGEIVAGQKYDSAAKMYFGELATTNF